MRPGTFQNSRSKVAWSLRELLRGPLCLLASGRSGGAEVPALVAPLVSLTPQLWP